MKLKLVQRKMEKKETSVEVNVTYRKNKHLPGE